MMQWEQRLLALDTHGVLIAKSRPPIAALNDLVMVGWAERSFFADNGDGIKLAYHITEAGRIIARRTRKAQA